MTSCVGSCKAIDADNKAAMPRWCGALRQIVGGGTTLSTDEKAALLGVPSPGRRQLFKIGGATIIGAAVLAACGDDDSGSVAGTTAAATAASADASMDLPLARTAASLEQLAVDTYHTAAGSGLVTTAGHRRRRHAVPRPPPGPPRRAQRHHHGRRRRRGHRGQPGRVRRPREAGPRRRVERGRRRAAGPRPRERRGADLRLRRRRAQHSRRCARRS